MITFVSHTKNKISKWSYNVSELFTGVRNVLFMVNLVRLVKYEDSEAWG